MKTYQLQCVSKSIGDGSVYLPTTCPDCVELFNLYSLKSHSYMRKGKKTITGDYEVEHTKCTAHSAKLSADAVTPKYSFYYASGREDTETLIHAKGSKSVPILLAPGFTATARDRYRLLDNKYNYHGTGKWISTQRYFYALTPYVYVEHFYRYYTHQCKGPDRTAEWETLRHQSRYYYVGWYSSRYNHTWCTGSTDWFYIDVTSSPFESPNWSYVHEHRQQFDRDLLVELKDKVKPNPKYSISNLYNGDYYETYAYDVESAEAKLDLSRFRLVQPTSAQLGDLCQDAVDNLNYVEINTMAYLKDLKEFGGELAALAKLVASPTNPKSWANFFLSYQYGSRLTIADTFELINGIIRAAKEVKKVRKKSWNTCRSRLRSSVIHPILGQGERQIHYKVYYKPVDQGIMKYIHKMAQWDLLPTSANLWDFIPFSFVLDWFVDIGGLLEAFDSAQFQNTLDVVGVLYSTKDTYQFQIEGSEAIMAEITQYQRKWSRTLHPPNLILEGSDGFLHNIPQLLAILVQRK